MDKMTNPQLKAMIASKQAINITLYDDSELDRIDALEKRLKQVAYVPGTFGISGALLKGETTGKMYAIVGRASNLFRYV